MKKYIFRSLVACAFLIIGASAANAQNKDTPHHTSSPAAIAAKVPVIIVGSAAKASWAVTKFSAGRIAAPVAKAVIVRGAPKATVFLLKNTGLGAKYLLPLAIKLSVL
jgi:hypothetical protein